MEKPAEPLILIKHTTTHSSHFMPATKINFAPDNQFSAHGH
jgi:hypothetical protein